VEHFLGEFWEMLAFFGNTLVFVISGIVIFSQLEFETLDGRDAGLLCLIYVVGTFLRGGIVCSTYALLKSLGHKLEWRDSLVATWGGLRGAVGLALAMIVYYDATVCNNIRNKAISEIPPPFPAPPRHAPCLPSLHPGLSGHIPAPPPPRPLSPPPAFAPRDAGALSHVGPLHADCHH